MKQSKDNNSGLVGNSILELSTLIAVVYSIKICNDVGEEWWAFTSIFTVTSILLVYVFANKKGIITKILSNGILVWIGEISSIMYMTHSVVIRYVDYVARRTINLNSSAMVVFVAVLSFAISLLSVWMWKQFIKIKDNLRWIK